jgi:hypothetical protein
VIFSCRKFLCEPCGARLDVWLWDSDPAPLCSCGRQTIPFSERAERAPTVIGDDIPGGMLLEHVAFKDGKPQRFYSKNAMREAARKAGWTRYGETPKAAKQREV